MQMKSQKGEFFGEQSLVTGGSRSVRVFMERFHRLCTSSDVNITDSAVPIKTFLLIIVAQFVATEQRRVSRGLR